MRAEHEWEAGRIAGATHLPLAELAERAGEMDKERPVVLYCRGGNRSSMAAAALAEAGYDAVKMSEGIVGWSEADLPLEPEGGYVAESGEAAAILQAREKGRLRRGVKYPESLSGFAIFLRMDVVVAENKEQRGKGRVGTIENPETYENVPGHIIPIIEREFDDFDNEAERSSVASWKRTSSSASGSNRASTASASPTCRWSGSSSLRRRHAGADGRLRNVVEYAPLNKGHVTTRQNIQIHHVPLRDMEELIREISAVRLSSREGCGNTVRNVTGDPWAGVAPDEIFDPTPYAGAFVRYFVRHPTTQLMPRKIKTAFSGSDEDRAITGIHDIAFISRERDGVRGFEVRVGGGTSIMARVAPTVYDFVEADNGDYLKVAEGIFRIFDRQDWLRVNRARARIKVLIDKIGIEAFREQLDEELEGDWVAEREFDADLVTRLRFDDDEQESPHRCRPPPPRRTATPPSSSASSRATSRRSARRASRPSR